MLGGFGVLFLYQHLYIRLSRYVLINFVQFKAIPNNALYFLNISMGKAFIILSANILESGVPVIVHSLSSISSLI